MDEQIVETASGLGYVDIVEGSVAAASDCTASVSA